MDSGGRQCGYSFIIHKNNKNDGQILSSAQWYFMNIATISIRIVRFVNL